MKATTLLQTTRKLLPTLLVVTLSACGSDSSKDSATETATTRCGDGRIDLGEECDGQDLGGRSCGSFRRDAQGTLRCDATCRLDASACEQSTCGDGAVEDFVDSGPEFCESCDGAALGGRSCAGFGGTGDLACSGVCFPVRSSCDGICLNGRLDPGEACDLDLASYAAIVRDGRTCESLGLGAGTLYCYLGGGTATTPFGAAPFAGCQLDVSGCTLAASTCGNGMRENTEACDGADLGGFTCAQLGLSGTLGCGTDCQFDVADCAPAPAPARCGNGTVEAGEECDGGRFAPISSSEPDVDLLSCVFGSWFGNGIELCTSDCRIDRDKCATTSLAMQCGDGVAAGYETCDGGDLRGLTCADLGGSGTLACSPFCTLDSSGCADVAGNGRRDGHETCDWRYDQPSVPDVGDATCESLGYGDGSLWCTLLLRSYRYRPPYWLQDPVLLPRLATYGCAVQGVCGDGRATDGEQCDGDDLAGADCETFDADGELRCTAGCAFDLTGCRSRARCGDGRLSFGEECEPATPRASCTADGGSGQYECDPERCFLDVTGCSFACSQ